MEPIQKRTWAEISLSNLAYNYHALRAMSHPDCGFVGVVKANAYGHGAVEIGRKLESLGVDYLAVACVDEGVALRQAGIEAPILILGLTAPQWAEELLTYGLTPSVAKVETALAYQAAAQAKNVKLPVHIKVDTGMSRIGLVGDNVADQVEAICKLPNLKVEGIFTHFADADGDEALTMLQLERFLALRCQLEEKNVTIPLAHCAASGAVVHYPCTHLDLIRPGIALYGHDPAGIGGESWPLKPVLTLKTRVAAVRELPAGATISYGCTHTLSRDSRVAVLPVGYGDGYPRALSNRHKVSISGTIAPILGRICMDMTMVDVTDLDGVAVGDEVVLYGEGVPIEAAAQCVGTIQYELLCNINLRVPRIYTEEPV